MSISSAPRVPKYWQLAEQFRRQVKDGQLKPGDRLPSYTEMRVQYGVSRPVVERIHAMLEREGVIVREPGRGTFVAEPRAQVTRGVIGFSGLPSGADRHPYGTHLLEGAQEVAHREHLEILLLNRTSSIEWEKVDGVLICEAKPQPTLSRLPPGMPCVIVLSAMEGISSVVADDRRGAFDATQHLLALGHRRIAYLTAAIDPLSQQRLAGYAEALSQARVELDGSWVRPLDVERIVSFLERGYEVMREWLETDWHELGCTGLLTQNDDTAIGAIRALTEAGLRVPDDVSVVGFDGTEISQLYTPSLTTVEVPLKEMSARGARMLLRQMESRFDHPAMELEREVFPMRLIARESTAPPPATQ